MLHEMERQAEVKAAESRRHVAESRQQAAERQRQLDAEEMERQNALARARDEVELFKNRQKFRPSCASSGRVDRASATEAVDLGSIPGRDKPKTIKIGIYSFPA